MSDRAEALTKKLRKECGNVPQWSVANTQECLDAHDSHWNIRRMYCGQADMYNMFRPLAKTLYRACKKDIGELIDVTEDTIKKWIAVDYMTDTQIKAKYQLQFDQEQPNIRKARNLLAQLRLAKGDCRQVGELHVLGWIELGFDNDPEAIRDRYGSHIENSKLVSRAEALRYRLQDELNDKEVATIPEIRDFFRENLDDDAIVAYYRERIPRPPERENVPTQGLLPGRNK